MTDKRESGGLPKWAIPVSFGVFSATILIGIWLAFAIKADSVITVDPQSGAITIEGPESEFTGQVSGQYKGRRITVSGLPMPKEIRKDGTVWRTFCGMRNDPDIDWSQASASLHAHINDERMDKLCAPFK